MENAASQLDALKNTLAPLARYACEEYTGLYRTWSRGMLVSVGRAKRPEGVERMRPMFWNILDR